MTKIPWLESEEFPDPRLALSSPNGLLAAGGTLSTGMLLKAYQTGIFPWFEDGQPLLWWSPDPRAVMRPRGFKVSRSLKKRLRQGRFRIFLNQDFSAVIQACAKPRAYADGTWITEEMQQAYIALNELGHAHCIAVYLEDELVGGLYGVAIGNMYCGESMFQRATDASKVAFAHLVRFMAESGSKLIDCQLENDHLMSLGCELIPRTDYLGALAEARTEPEPDWRCRELVYDWNGSIIVQ